MKKIPFCCMVVLSLLAIATFLEGIVSAFQCPGLADEPWLLYLVHHQISAAWTMFAQYFAFSQHGSFCDCRLLNLLLHLVSGAFLGWTVYDYFKVKCGLTAGDKWVMIAVIPCLLSLSQVVFPPSYTIANYIFACLAIGALVLCEGSESKKSHAWSAASGALAIQLPFFMPTNVVLLPLLLLVLFLHRKSLAMSFVAGCAIGLALFFAVICPPCEFIETVQAFSQLSYDTTDGHDFMMLVRWLIQTGFDFLPFVAIGMALSFFRDLKSDVKPVWKWLVLAALGVCGLYHAYVHLHEGVFTFTLGRVDLCLLYLMASCVAFAFVRERKLLDSDNLLLVLFLLAPLCLSFGTNVNFAHRGGRYMIFLLLIIWPLLRKYQLKAGYVFLILFACVYGFFGLKHIRAVNGYTGVRLWDSRTSLREFGSACLAPESRVRELKTLQALTADRDILIGGRESWFYVDMLHKQPLTTMWCQPRQIAPILKKTPVEMSKVFLLEQPSFKLSANDETEIKSLFGASSIRRLIVSPTLTVVFFEE